MPTYRYHLQKYSPTSKKTCPACGRSKCFTLYVDADNRPAGDRFGICDHAGCGYRLYPTNTAPTLPPIVEKKADPVYYTKDDVKAYRKAAMNNNLCKFLAPKFHTPYFDRVLKDYCIGSVDYGIIFWQIDEQYRVHRGKVMWYNPDGHRTKIQNPDGTERGRIKMMWQFLHRDRATEPEMCYFGQHLVSLYPDKPVALVESEKTAIIMSYFFPWFNWIATLSLNNFQAYRLGFLKGYRRPVIVFPDFDGFDKWQDKAIAIKNLAADRLIFVDDFITQYGQGHDDMADLFIRHGYNIFPQFDTQMQLYFQV